MPSHRIDLPDLAATTALATSLAAMLTPGMILCLDGDLGAGKTTLAQGVIRILLGQPDAVIASPTFNLVNSYDHPSPLPSRRRPFLLHCDLYRLNSPLELEGIGLLEALMSPDLILVIEWPGLLQDYLAQLPLCRQIHLHLDHCLQTGSRYAVISALQLISLPLTETAAEQQHYKSP